MTASGQIIEKRCGNQGLGFGAQVLSKKQSEKNDILQKVEPQDMLKFGIIPELIGRLPIIIRFGPAGQGGSGAASSQSPKML